MATFFSNAAFIFAILAFFALNGWWAIAPFCTRLAFSAACAAMAGLILVPCSVLAVHVVLALPYWKALAIASPILIGASFMTAVVLGRQEVINGVRKGIGTTIVLALAAALFTSWAVTRTDIFFDGPGFLYSFGTDHLGYANMADWMLLNGSNTPLTPDPRDVFGSYPDYLLKYDPRFGVFSLLALIALLSGRPGAFAYDLTCAIALSCAALGLGGLFARSRLVFVCLVIALLTSTWFDLSRTGYLGKIVGYPAALLVVGLFFCFMSLVKSRSTYPLGSLGALAALVASASLMFNAVMTALLLALLGSVLLIFMMAGERKRSFRRRFFEDGKNWLVLGGLIIAAILTSGVIARPLYVGRAAMDVGWPYLLERSAQIVGPDSGLTILPSNSVKLVALILLLLWIGLGIVAFREKLAEAAALTIGPVLLMGILYVLDEQWVFHQTTSIYVPTAVCAGAVVLDTIADRARNRDGTKWFLIFAFFFMIVIAIARVIAALRIFGGDLTPALYRFSLNEIEQIASVVGMDGAAIDIGDGPHLNIFLVVELGRRRIPMQISDRSWRTFMGYRPWSAPRLEHPRPYLIVTRSDANSESPNLVLRTTQYDLLRQP